jgi:hypothetical protein
MKLLLIILREGDEALLCEIMKEGWLDQKLER